MDNLTVKGEELARRVGIEYGISDRYEAAFKYKGKAVNINDIEVEFIAESSWINPQCATDELILASTANGLVNVEVSLAEQSGQAFLHFSIQSGTKKQMRSSAVDLITSSEPYRMSYEIDEEYLIIDAISAESDTMYRLQVKYQENADMFYDIFVKDKDSEEDWEIFEEFGYDTKEDIAVANDILTDGLVRKCNSCGAINWNELHEKCEYCDDSDLISPIGWMVDILEDIKNEAVREWAEDKLGWTKLSVIKVDDQKGLVFVKNRENSVTGFALKVGELA